MTGRISVVLLILSFVVLGSGAVSTGFDILDFHQWVWGIIGSVIIGGVLVLASWYSSTEIRYKQVQLLIILTIGVLLRVLLMNSQRELSDDAARYHWDGKVLASGVNPYQYPPDDSRLHGLRGDPPDSRINHPWVRTVYPPLAEMIFSIGYLLTPGRYTGIQIVALIAEIVTWLILGAALHGERISRMRLLLIVLSPLIIFEGYLPNHVDIYALPFVAWMMVAGGRGKAMSAGAALALAVLIKPLALIFLPALVLEIDQRQRVRFFAIFFVLVIGAYLPFISAGRHLFSSLFLMAEKWSNNGSIGALLESTFPGLLGRGAAGVLILGSIYFSLRYTRDYYLRLLLAATAFIVFTPNLFPWYLFWIYPILVLRPDPALLLLGTFVILTEEIVPRYRETGAWEPRLWVSLVLYGIFYGVLLFEVITRRGLFARGYATAKKAHISTYDGTK